MTVFEFLEYMCLPHAHISLGMVLVFPFLSLSLSSFSLAERGRDTQKRERASSGSYLGVHSQMPVLPSEAWSWEHSPEVLHEGRAPTTFFLDGVNLPT